MSSKVVAGTVLLLALYYSDRWAARSESCVQPCRSLRDGSLAQTRCVRNACRDKVFRYYIRFGKRTSSSPNPKLRQQRPSAHAPRATHRRARRKRLQLSDVEEMLRRHRRKQSIYQKQRSLLRLLNILQESRHLRRLDSDYSSRRQRSPTSAWNLRWDLERL